MVLLPLAAAVLAACGGSGGGRAETAAAADTPAARRVWTPDQARALRQARERDEEVAPAAVVVVPVPGPSEGEDSARWAAEEKVKYDQRVRSMGSYAECMAQARQVTGDTRARLEAACGNLPTAPH
jgi:ABC-type glycerol-3-phosphate transport system substrate-binding protein